MNTKSLAIGLLLATTSIVSTAQEYPTLESNFISTKTRAQVKQELADANTAETPSVIVRDDSYPAAVAVHSGKSREQVKAELAEYNRQNPRGYLYSYYLGN